MKRPKLLAAAISAVLFPSLAVLVFWVGDLTVNMTSSMPIGIWSVEALEPHQSIPRGSVVMFCPPDIEIFQKAKAQGILLDGYCSGSYMPLIKQVLGLPGDVIEYDGGFSVNGQKVPNSEILSIDMGHFGEAGKRVVVPKDKVWLMSPYSALSFDGRYFGLIDETGIVGLATPRLVENMKI